MMMETEAAVMVNLDFLTNADVDMEDDDDINEDVDLEPGDEMDDDVKAVKRKGIFFLIQINNNKKKRFNHARCDLYQFLFICLL